MGLENKAGKWKRTEMAVYGVAWLVVVGLYLLDVIQNRSRLHGPLIDLHTILRIVRTLIPFLALFVVTNYLLIPRFLLRDKVKSFLSLSLLCILCVWGFQTWDFYVTMQDRPPMPRPDLRPLLPLPLLLDLIYCLLVVGVNVAVALVFRRFDDALERESLQKENAESQLAYLKAQINPHFYMNMLNNIHGLIEIAPERAQTMVIDLSNLMRFMLYDSSKPTVPLSDEIAFLTNYLRLMRQRYPADKVRIESCFPSPEEARGVSLPPLLFLVFVENAFKHGVSYQKASFVDVSIRLTQDAIEFHCFNSITPGSRSINEESGIGLRNIRERLRLLYDERARLTIDETENDYRVILCLPRQKGLA